MLPFTCAKPFVSAVMTKPGDGAGCALRKYASLEMRLARLVSTSDDRFAVRTSSSNWRANSTLLAGITSWPSYTRQENCVVLIQHGNVSAENANCANGADNTLVAGRNDASSCAGKTSVLVINRVPARFSRTPKPAGKSSTTMADAPLVPSVSPAR